MRELTSEEKADKEYNYFLQKSSYKEGFRIGFSYGIFPLVWTLILIIIFELLKK